MFVFLVVHGRANYLSHKVLLKKKKKKHYENTPSILHPVIFL